MGGAAHPRPLGLVGAPSRAAVELRRRPLHGPRRAGAERYGPTRRSRTTIRRGHEVRHCGRASQHCWRSCTGTPGSRWRCWSTSTTSRSWMPWTHRRSRAPTATTSAGWYATIKEGARAGASLTWGARHRRATGHLRALAGTLNDTRRDEVQPRGVRPGPGVVTATVALSNPYRAATRGSTCSRI